MKDSGRSTAAAAIARALTVAGSDSGGCAGIQADIKTFGALGIHGMSAITSVTAQNTAGVVSMIDLPVRMIEDQIDATLTDIGADAVKTGMLASREIIEAVAGKLREHRVRNLVVDPVMVATSGDRLSDAAATSTLVTELLPLARLLTPNLHEAEVLLHRRFREESELEDAARHLLEMGPGAVLLKGGHLENSPFSVDVYCDRQTCLRLSAPRIDTRNTHGSGCTLSAAIAAFLARGYPLLESCERAKEYVTGALQHSLSIGSGRGPLGHFWAHRGGE